MKIILKILFHLIFSAAVICLVFALENSSAVFSFNRKLCDGFFLSAVFLFFYMTFSFINRNGLFDGIAYSFKKLFNRTKCKTYFDYIQQKEQKIRLNIFIPLVFAVTELAVSICLI